MIRTFVRIALFATVATVVLIKMPQSYAGRKATGPRQPSDIEKG